MRRITVLAFIVVLAATGFGCGSGGGSTGGTARSSALTPRAHRQARLAIQREHRAEAHQLLIEQREAEAAEQAEAAPPEESECDPNYTGACLNPAAYDYDCAGGSGDGPEYTGTVTVVGEDHFGLDADSDGTGCE